MFYSLLLIDDDNNMLTSLARYLSKHQFQITIAENYDRALFHLHQYKPDLIISDVLMDYGTGYKLVETLHKIPRYQQIPLIFLTAKNKTKDKIHGYNLACSGYLTKPFDPNELLALVHSVLINKRKYNTQTFHNHENSTYLQVCTRREQAVMKALVCGMTNKEIATYLDIHIRSVEKHISKILQKTNNRNRIELVKSFYTQPLNLQGE